MLFILIHFMCLIFAPILLIITIPLHIIMAGFNGNKKVARESASELQAIREELQAIRKQGWTTISADDENKPATPQATPESREQGITFGDGFVIGMIIAIAVIAVWFMFGR